MACSFSTAIALRGEQTSGAISVAAEAQGVAAPAWAMLPVPSVTKVGPPIGG